MIAAASSLRAHATIPVAIPQQVVLMLHGYGSNGENVLGVARHLLARLLPHTVFIAPNAPQSFEGDPGGDGHQWFSMMDRTPEALRVGVRQAQQSLQPIISDIQQVYQMPPVVMGFSQGAMVAAQVALRGEQQVAGLIMCSGALIDPAGLAAELGINASSCQILLTHGDRDDVVPHSMSVAAAAEFAKCGLKHRLFTEPGVSHSVGMLAAGTILGFLKQLCASNHASNQQ